ncbi:hypothetical protein RSAG8_09546, partial [Rhizoctonia solani AG-8 WAC10335]
MDKSFQVDDSLDMIWNYYACTCDRSLLTPNRP